MQIRTCRNGLDVYVCPFRWWKICKPECYTGCIAFMKIPQSQVIWMEINHKKQSIEDPGFLIGGGNNPLRGALTLLIFKIFWTPTTFWSVTDQSVIIWWWLSPVLSLGVYYIPKVKTVLTRSKWYLRDTCSTMSMDGSYFMIRLLGEG